MIVRPSGPGLMLHTLYFHDEVRQVAEYGQNDGVHLTDKELELGKLFVSSLAAPFDASNLPIASPSPDPPPVTSATFPVNELISLSCSRS